MDRYTLDEYEDENGEMQVGGLVRHTCGEYVLYDDVEALFSAVKTYVDAVVRCGENGNDGSDVAYAEQAFDAMATLVRSFDK